MNRMVRRCLRFGVAAIILWCAFPAHAEEAPEPDPRPGALTLGLFAGEKEFYTQGDILFPLYRYDAGLLFLNPRGAISDRSEEEFNVGLGLRHIVDARYPFILGGNVYYDARWSRHNNRFDQIGAGLEFLSDWVDARVNYYWPDKDKFLIDTVETESTARSRRTQEQRQVVGWQDPYADGHQILQDYVIRTTIRDITTTRTLRQTFERFEAALEGWDAELGGRLPVSEDIPLELRVFGGYQHFDHPFGSSLKGWKGRLEVRALKGHLTLDAHAYENRELNRGDYLVGARVHLPFDLAAVAQGRNPFAGLDRERPSGLEGRLAEMVMRDPKIQTRESGYIENVSRREESVSERNSTTVRNQAITVPIIDGVIFVDGERGDDDNPGTAEQPKGTVQGGVVAVFDETTFYTITPWWEDDVPNRMVYVFDTEEPYQSGWGMADLIVLDQPGIVLFGSGVPFPCYGGKLFGSGIQPVVMGASQQNAIEITINGDYAVIAGFGITTAESGSRGIYSESGRIDVFANHIWGTGDGIFMLTSGDVESYFNWNRFGGEEDFEKIYRSGIHIEAFGDHLQAQHLFLDLWGNEFYGHRNENPVSEPFYTVDIDARGYNSAFAIIEDNDMADNDYGLRMALRGGTGSDGDFVVYIWENHIRDIRHGGGMEVSVRSSEGDGDVLVRNNVVEHTLGETLDNPGIFIGAWAEGKGNAMVWAEYNRTDNNEGHGQQYIAIVNDDGDATVRSEVNTATGNASIGISVEAYATGSGTADARSLEDTAMHNEGVGIYVTGRIDGDGRGLAEAQRSHAHNNEEGGILVSSWSSGGRAGTWVMGNQAFANGDDWTDPDDPQGFGIRAQAEAPNDMATIDADGNQTYGNARYGLQAIIQADDGRARLENNIANGNIFGIDLDVEASHADAILRNNTAMDNLFPVNGLAARGIGVRLDTDNPALLTFEDNVMRGNVIGLDLVFTDAGSTADDRFKNNSFDNLEANLRYNAPAGADLDAQENWWGTVPPGDFKIEQLGVGTVDSTDWLAEDPNP